MKSSTFRRIVFAVAVAASAAACGDRPAPTPEVAPEPESHRVLPPQKPIGDAPTGVAEPVAAKPMPEPADYADAMKLGKQAAAAKDAVVARAMFDIASRLDDSKVDPQLELARLFLTTGENKLALTSARKAVKLAPESSAAWNTLGRAQLARFAYDEAITAFEKAIDKNANNVYAWNNLGFTMLELELWSEARNALEEATALPDATGYMFNNLGLAYEHLELFDEARVAFEQGGDKGSAPAKYNRTRLEGVTEVASVDVVISDVRLVDPAVEPMVEETGQIEEAAIVEDAVKAEAEAEAEAEGEGEEAVVEDTKSI